MSNPEPSIRINVDVTNPGQFFACCGLLELADRIWPGAEARFEEREFCLCCHGTLEKLLNSISETVLEQIDLGDDMSSPLRMPSPFDLTLDWWTDELFDGKQLKVWAGSMRSARIARAMQKAMGESHELRRLLDYATVVHDPDQRNKKVEPYYFDSRRGCNAQSLDIGFAPDSLKMTTMAYPAVEFLCLVGLQRFRPAYTKNRRVFEYYVWNETLPPQIATLACKGMLATSGSKAYRFENGFRTDQKKHKSFLPATQVGASV